MYSHWYWFINLALKQLHLTWMEQLPVKRWAALNIFEISEKNIDLFHLSLDIKLQDRDMKQCVHW